MTVRRLSFWALLAFAASIPLEDSVNFGVGRISKVLGIVALVVWLFAVAAKGTLRRPAPAMWLASAFVVWSLFSYLWSSTPDATLVKVRTLAELLSVVWIVWDQVSDEYDLIVLIRAFLLGAFGAAALTMYSAAIKHAREGARFASNNAGPNNTGCLLAVAIPMTFLLLRWDDDRRYRRWYVAFLPFAVVALILTASRTAAVSMVVGLAILALDRRVLTTARIARLIPVGLVAALFAAFLVPQKAWDRLGTTSSEISSGSLNGRTYYWHLSWNLFVDHPIQGVGSGAFPQINLLLGARGIVAHNAFLSILAETGAVGLLLFVGAFALAGLGLLPERQDRRRAWFAIGATWAVGASTLTWEVRKITWFVLAIALVQARLTAVAAHKRRAELAAAGPPPPRPAALAASTAQAAQQQALAAQQQALAAQQQARPVT